jgi:flagellar basal body-associated protein FliL
MGYFLTVFILLIAAAGVGYVAGHGPNRPAPATAATAKPVTPPPPPAPKVIPANPVTDVPTQSSQ